LANDNELLKFCLRQTRASGFWVINARCPKRAFAQGKLRELNM